MAGGKVLTRVLVDTHQHDGRLCKRGDVVKLHPRQIARLKGRVERVNRPAVDTSVDASADFPDAPEAAADSSTGTADDDPDPERPGSELLPAPLDHADEALGPLGLQIDRGE